MGGLARQPGNKLYIATPSTHQHLDKFSDELKKSEGLRSDILRHSQTFSDIFRHFQTFSDQQSVSNSETAWSDISPPVTQTVSTSQIFSDQQCFIHSDCQ